MVGWRVAGGRGGEGGGVRGVGKERGTRREDPLKDKLALCDAA